MAKYNGWHGLVSVEAKTNMKSGVGIFSPLLRADYGTVNIGQYTESGTVGSNLTVHAQQSNSAITSTGLDVREKLRPSYAYILRVI